ncbi:MAG: VCBS repeat-containing protein, partial [Planctomycetaceae bacterium]|nr:VCBS repeat-containing protein [Planctomycetaceae bacterium]
MSWPRPPLRLLILIGVVLASAGCPEDKSATVPPAATPPVAPTTATPPAIDWSRAFELRNRGNAYLENGELESASTDLNELCRLLPQEPLGFRNRTIASLLALEGINKVSASAAFAEALSMAKADLAALRTVEPSAPTTHLLAARLEAADGAIATAAAELRQALESNPEDASTWFELFELTRYETSPDQTQMARDALAKAHQFAPQNLFVLIEYLQLQAAQQEASIQQTFEQARVTLEPLADGIARRVRVNPLDLLDQAEQAQTQGDWRAVERSTRIIANVTRPDDAAQSDRQRIDRHPLEFMLTEWQATEVPNEATATSPVVPESPFAFSSGGEAVSLPVIDGVRDAFFADFGIDGRDEYWVIAEDGVQVFHRDSDGDNAWSQLAAVAVSGEYVRAIAVDLDQDVVESPPPVDAPEGQLPSVNHTADLDLILFGPGGIAVLKNVAAEEARRLEPVDINPELGALRDVRQLIAVDVNSDGDLDLVTVSPDGPAWWSNRGNFEFAPAPPLGGAPANVTAITAVDLDRDVDLDLVVGLETGAIGYFENLRHGTFRYREIGGNAAALKDAVVSLEVADIDGNVSWDIVAAAETGVALYSSRWIEPGEVQFEPPA